MVTIASKLASILILFDIFDFLYTAYYASTRGRCPCSESPTTIKADSTAAAASQLSSFMLLHIDLFIRKKHTSIERQR